MKHEEKHNEGIFSFDKFRKKKEPTMEPVVEEPKKKKNDIPDEEVFITKINGVEFHEVDDYPSIPHDIWMTISPYVKRDCYHCAFLKAAVTLWCRNDEAIEYRGTAIPGVFKCIFWQPNEKVIKETKKELKKLDEETD